jgi:hypothetical protein
MVEFPLRVTKAPEPEIGTIEVAKPPEFPEP